MSKPQAQRLAGLMMQQLFRHLRTYPAALAPPEVACDIRQDKLFVTGTLPFAARMSSAHVDAFLRGFCSQVRLPVQRTVTVERIDTISGTVTLSIELHSGDH